MTISPAGPHAITAGEEGQALVWDLEAERVVVRLNFLATERTRDLERGLIDADIVLVASHSSAALMRSAQRTSSGGPSRCDPNLQSAGVRNLWDRPSPGTPVGSLATLCTSRVCV